MVKICNYLIEYSFYLLFALVPLALTPWNYELFEFNKMLLTYGLTIIIVTAWVSKMVLAKKFIFRRTFMDIPLLIFLASQITSTLLSIDRHTSLFGYYSRLHGGLFSTISYLLLYWALVSNISDVRPRCEVILSSESGSQPQAKRGGKFHMSEKGVTNVLDKSGFTTNCLLVLLGSATLVSLYGVAEHFGIDAQYWVQDVRNRVFSTLGQPNWLAAWLVALIPLTWSLTLSVKLKMQNAKRQSKIQRFLNFNMYFLFLIFYICILFTNSRSGLLGFGVVYFVFWSSVLWLNRQQPKRLLKSFLLVTCSLLLVTSLIGTPWTPNIKDLTSNRQPAINNQQLTTSNQPPLLITESGDIRKIVWEGALNVWRRYPLFGTGVETFAYSYYWHRPREHNDVSEWDFLYNKAHNEYLNFLATTGIVGLGSYLLVIAIFIIWSLRKLKIKSEKLKVTVKNSKLTEEKFLTLNCNFALCTLHFALFAGFASILVTNFFGFSVVPVALLFFLYPAMSVTLTSLSSPANRIPVQAWECTSKLSAKQRVMLIAVLVTGFYLLFSTVRYWQADFIFARGEKLEKAGWHQQAYQRFEEATQIRPSEPLYHDALALTAANLAVKAFEQENATLSAQLIEQAIEASSQTLKISPYHLNFWKNQARVFYKLAEIDENYNQAALATLLKAAELAPTDAKVAYNLGLLYAKLGQKEMAVQTLEKTIELKPNYADAHYALALFYEQEGKIDKAREQLEYVLEKINPEHELAQEKLEEL